MFRSTTLAFVVGVSAQSADAQTILWRTLAVGESPQATESKLKEMPEVKSVKTKLRGETVREQDINMRDGGVPIFDGHFSIATSYDKLSLSKVQLSSGNGCANTAFQFASQLADELSKKYPTTLLALPDGHAFTMQSLDATSTTPTRITGAFSNGQAAVFLTAEFQYEDPPTYVSGALGRALYQIARAGYDSRRNSCGGTGYRTAIVRLTYLAQIEVDAELKIGAEEAEQARLQARDNL